jgi:PAS domain S-box-containing protein
MESAEAPGASPRPEREPARRHLFVAGAAAVAVAAVAAVVTYQVASRFLLAEAQKQVENVLFTNRGLHLYIQRVMHPEFYRARDEGEIRLDYYAPQILSSSYIVRRLQSFFNEERSKEGRPPVYYKMAADNPRNPANLADAREHALIRLFNERRDLKEVREVVEIDGQRYLYYAIPFLETGAQCLVCHGKRAAAPPGLQAIYPGEGGFNDEVGRIRAIESVRAPLRGQLAVVTTTTAAFTAAALAFLGLGLFNRQLRRRVRQQTESLHGEVAVRAAAEVEAQRLKDELTAIVDSMPAIIVALDEAGYVTVWNEEAERVTGRPSAEVLGQPVASLLPELASSIEEVRREVVERRRPATRERLSMTRDGRLRVVDLLLYPLAGAPRRGAVLRIEDVTTQVEIEANLAQGQKLEAIGTLAGGIAHDFNNILSAILGTSEVALASTEDPVLREDLQSISQSSRRAGELVKQILAFSRRAPEAAVALDPAAVAREALRLLRASVPASIEIRARLVSTLEVVADPADLHRILVNLGANAAVAMRGHPGLLEIDVEDRPSTDGGGDRVRLFVRDTGCGMEPEVRDRIFEPFFTTHRNEGGTGLGLSVVHGIVQRLGGTLRVESEPGRGAEFEILLPGRRRSEAAAAAGPAAPSHGSERILFVDDEAALAAAAQRTLRSLGYRVSTFTRATEALSAFRASPGDFDVLVTDYTMPAMSGDALAHEIRRVRPDLPVILCTGFSEGFDEGEAERHGIDRFAMKPLAGSDIARLIREVVDRR